MGGNEQVEIYVATGEEDPHVLKIGGRPVVDLVDEANGHLGKRKGIAALRLRTVTDPEFALSRFSEMNWSTEKMFRDRVVGLCVIDGRHFRRFTKEIFTIRAHHFPPHEDYPGFCIVFPEKALEDQDRELNEGEALERLQQEFRCKLVEPTEEGFKSFVRALTVLAQIGPATLEEIFGKEV